MLRHRRMPWVMEVSTSIAKAWGEDVRWSFSKVWRSARVSATWMVRSGMRILGY